MFYFVKQEFSPKNLKISLNYILIFMKKKIIIKIDIPKKNYGKIIEKQNYVENNIFLK